VRRTKHHHFCGLQDLYFKIGDAFCGELIRRSDGGELGECAGLRRSVEGERSPGCPRNCRNACATGPSSAGPLSAGCDLAAFSRRGAAAGPVAVAALADSPGAALSEAACCLFNSAFLESSNQSCQSCRHPTDGVFFSKKPSTVRARVDFPF
jgi:hypothetical protein